MRRHNNRKIISSLLFTLLFFFLTFAVWDKCVLCVYADNGETIVHVTKAGVCYHREGCSHLQSDIEITLYEAVVEYGYNPCLDCNPPIYDGPAELHAPMEKHQSGGISSNTKNKRNDSNNTASKVSIERKKSKAYTPFIGIVVLFLPVLLIYYSSKKGEKENRIKKEQEAAQLKIRAQERKKYYVLYAGKDPLSLVSVPQGAFLRDNYPSTVGDANNPFGEYTVYIGRKNNTTFHFNPHCNGADLVPVNYYTVRNLNHCKKCGMRGVNLPKLDWYIEYLEIERIKKEYNIP